MNRAKRYGSGGKPLLLRLNVPEREAWGTLKTRYENKSGQRLSHSRFVCMALADLSTSLNSGII